MPGVPPDALAQVKKGLKGLFGRKKRGRDSAPQSHTASAVSSSKPLAAASPAAGLVAAPNDAEEIRTENLDVKPLVEVPSTSAEPHETTSAPKASGPSTLPETHKSQPITLEQSKAVELHPAPVEDLPATAIHPAKSHAAPGMSATSGPLDDAREFAHGDGEDVVGQEGSTGREAGGSGLVQDELTEQR